MASLTVLETTTKPQQTELGPIFEEHYDLVYRTACGVTGSAADAEDVVQSIFLQLLQRKVPLNLTKNPRGYFYRAAVNLSLRAIRLRQRQILTDDPDRLQSLTESAMVRPNTDELNSAEMDERLWKAIAELHENASQIFILRHVHNYSLGEISRLLGTTRGTVAVSLFRSRTRLKKVIRASQGAKS